ncbi:hypothetical protein PV410_17020 [Streptomyces sp. PA03-5A]|nr:hypothetical protein [Streptomyces sp. PA03-5A]
MPEITIPQNLVALQRAVDAARAAVRERHRACGPVLGWDAETRADGIRLQDAWRQAAEALQAAVEEDGREIGDSYKYRIALRAAPRDGEDG